MHSGTDRVKDDMNYTRWIKKFKHFYSFTQAVQCFFTTYLRFLISKKYKEKLPALDEKNIVSNLPVKQQL